MRRALGPTVLVLLALAACGGDDAPSAGPAATTTDEVATEGSPPARSPACNAVSAAAVARAVREAGGPTQPLERTANDSLDLSICSDRERSGPDVYVSVTIDTAPNTARRYYNLIAEARQRATFEAIPDDTQPVGVHNVGNDHAHGGVGAYWTPYRSQLTAVDDRTLVKVAFNVPGATAQESRAAATELARAVFDRG